MTDLVQLQNDFAQALLGDDWLANVNVVTRWHLLDLDIKRADRELAAEVLAYLTPRNGRKGCGIIVEVPEVAVASGNLPGPEFDLAFVCLVLEDPITNQGPQTGTLKPADQVAQRILDVGHGWRVEPHGEFYAKGSAMVRAADFAPLRSFRTRLNLKLPRTQTSRAALPAIAEDAGTITLTPASGVLAYYTLDESFPGPGNAKATLYSAPFTVDAGTVIRWAGFDPDKLPGYTGHAVVS